ncbi:ATP-binding cassette domain-containing protein [Halorubrum ezzemoulense]|uniref:ATP-binding cassette domain-containing protein n=1 Tax=Halorubrum ezzemoulense TaxID=337243 RepID=A0ABT4Z338_HALEZ|nr:ATP-binding cassette domain-containing protein [Halorubrum ezzemoulense]MDB2242428.1 ATP-binding cassette domain-containing protein [Halorubrum ezzemoulense]MDB2244671.1 ATP-binding cassette domain-containing protein [Halorubrum ezzemoulense]MDB2250878.1 ATP-binding cassette domain-containing protein [Halorubrum ezzemoulense]MDB2260940.1 ATP-binding cassette domain-containing protein [Halorubrum ezzemoulense]MDB2268971.1 ATP-binding cassette domain-containing protein [Halorubrum ezzemoulens
MSADPTVDAETTGAADAAESAAGGGDGSEALPDTALSFGDAPLLSAADVAVSFGDLDVVSGVDLRVEPGSLVGLVGPNGAGKTTVLRAVTGAVEPDAGTVRLGGDPASSLSAREVGRRVASVPQTTNLSFDFRVRHVVEMGRTPHLGRFDAHGTEDDAAVDAAMAAADVERFADRSITEVSGGERQRVLLARALAQAAPLLLLDEPTASLDVHHAVETLELVREFVDGGDRGAIAAIHDLDAAARYCDEVVVIANGGVQAAGPPESVLSASAVGAAFDAEAFVGRNPATGTPAVTAFPESDADPRSVHVIGSGRSGARVVARLAAAGHEPSVGVVPEGDAAAGAAADAGATAVTAPPFEDPSPEALAAARDLAADADATLVVAADGDVAPTANGPNAEVAAAADRVVDVADDVDDAELLDAVAAASGAEPAE